MYVTLSAYADIVGVCKTTASRRLSGAPFRIPTKENGRHYYMLTAAVMALTPSEIEAGAIGRLAGSARLLNDELYIEPEALSAAQDFAQWLPSSEMRSRLARVQSAFVVAVANSPLCTATVVASLEPLRALFALNADVTRYVLVGGPIPNVDALAPAFAISNNSALLNQHAAELLEAA
ncbi:hypothetical protein LCM27_07610 [Ruegeria marisrubri]|uniref:hypothetical protein n=1 Tax=Ruegeria marisrubri TaxID=1685379 RepID=UPI001CD27C70|nr:hypothetical protein [Ruegeria marisrubri]MCA0906259.1 hypothetical protein [Ruegeria marisrubri]